MKITKTITRKRCSVLRMDFNHRSSRAVAMIEKTTLLNSIYAYFGKLNCGTLHELSSDAWFLEMNETQWPSEYIAFMSSLRAHHPILLNFCFINNYTDNNIADRK